MDTAHTPMPANLIEASIHALRVGKELVWRISSGSVSVARDGTDAYSVVADLHADEWSPPFRCTETYDNPITAAGAVNALGPVDD